MSLCLRAKQIGYLGKVFAIIFFCIGPALPMDISKWANDEDVLSQVLNRASQYCETLKGSVLDFVCVEKIKEKINHGKDHEDYRSKMFRTMGGMMSKTKRAKISRTKTNSYVYDYQLIKKGAQTYEKRTLLEENGKNTREEHARLKLETFRHRFVVLGPVGLLSKEWQKHHEFEIIANKRFQGKKTWVIQAMPKNPDEINHLYGKIWVDETDFSILKIEWDVKSVENYDKIIDFARKINAEPRITMISAYGIEKNGIRFPSKYSIREAYQTRGGGVFVRSDIEVTYEEYKFFTVETTVKYRTNPNPREKSAVNMQ
jgi:hypothetical protein